MKLQPGHESMHINTKTASVTKHLCQTILKSFHAYENYRLDMNCCIFTFKLLVWPWPWDRGMVLSHDISSWYAKYFCKVIWKSIHGPGHTDGRTDSRCDFNITPKVSLGHKKTCIWKITFIFIAKCVRMIILLHIWTPNCALLHYNALEKVIHVFAKRITISITSKF